MGFLLPGFLIAGAVLAGVPLAIHLLNRRRYRVVDFAAMQFLMAAVRQNRRRLQLREWLLLAARIAAVALMGFALARPISCNSSGSGGIGGQAATLQVLVVDDTYSMGATGKNGSALGEMKKLLAGLIGKMRPGVDEVAIVRVARPVQISLAPTYDLQQALQQIEAITIRQTPGDLTGAIALATQIASGEKGVARRRMYVASDLTAGTWALAEAGRRDQLSQAVSAAAAACNAGIDIIGTTPLRSRHVALTELAVGEASGSAAGGWAGGRGMVTTNTPLAVEVTARAGAAGAAGAGGTGGTGGLSTKVEVDIEVDGKPLASGLATLKPAPDGRLTAEVPIGVLPPASGGGGHLITASLVGEDPLALDRSRSITVQIPDAVRVLVVEGDRGGDSRPSSGSFVSLALSPRAATTRPGRDPFRTESVADIALPSARLEEYGVVVLADVTPPDATTVARLDRFVRAGGLVVNLLGEHLAAAIGPAGKGRNAILSLVPGNVTQLVQAAGAGSSGDVTAGRLIDFSPTGNVHPLLGAFAGVQRTGLESTPVFKYWRVERTAAAGPGIAASLGEPVLNLLADKDGHKDPLLLAERRGNGAIITCTAPLGGEEWTTLQARPAFVPLVQELVRNALPDLSARWNILAGESVVLSRLERMVGTPTLIGPLPKTDRIEFESGPIDAASTQPTQEGGSAMTEQAGVRSAAVPVAGLYQLTGLGEARTVAVNLLAWPEADLRALEEPELRTLLAVGSPSSGGSSLRFHAATVPEVVGNGAATAGSGGRDWTMAALLFVIGLLAMESWLAQRPDL